MNVVSDIHGAFEALRRVVQAGEPTLILGDLINFVDYRTGAGVVSDLFGVEFVGEVRRLRAANDFDGSRQLWREKAATMGVDLREAITEHVGLQYEQCREALEGGESYLIHGNVDSPDLLTAHLPAGAFYVQGQVKEIEGWTVGFAGGGAATPLAAPGEVGDEEMESLLDALGPVEVLCTHVPPAIEPLAYDTVTGRPQRSSRPILDYLRRHRPRYHFFGDVHQPRATRWQVGATGCRNVGYFRATGRAHQLEPKR